MAQGRSSYQADDGLHHTSDDPNAQFTSHQAQYDPQAFIDDMAYLKPMTLDQIISATTGVHGQQTHAGTTPTLISSPGNQSATASSTFTSPHLTTPPTSYDHQAFPNNISLLPLFSSTSASTAPQGGHAPINAFEPNYSGSASNAAFPPPFVPNAAPVAGPSRPQSLSPASAHPLLNGIHSTSEEHEVSITSLLQQCDPKEVEARFRDYSSFALNPQLQMEWLRVIYNWVVRRTEPTREDHFHFLSAHHAPMTQKNGGPGSRGGAQAYTCMWPGCGKELKSRADRAQEHILEHLEIKPFQCENCLSASFLRKNDCSRHEKTCKTSSAPRGTKRKAGARTAPYPEVNTRRATATRTSSPSNSRSTTDSPIARMNLLQMSPLHMTSPLSPSSVSPQQFFMADAVPSSSPTTTRYAEAQLQSPLRGIYPQQLPTASSSVPVATATANGLLFQHMPPSMMPSPRHHPSYSMPTFHQFDVQGSLSSSSVSYHYPHSNGSNDSFMPMQGSPDSHQPFPHM